VHKGFLQALGLGFAPDKKHPSRKPPTGPVTKEEKDKLEEFSE
jgi:hypothetical protein